MENCSRLALEAEQSLPIAQTIGEAVAVLSATLSVTPPQAVTTVSSEVASAVVEAEELVDDLLRVIQVSSYHVLAPCAMKLPPRPGVQTVASYGSLLFDSQ